MKKKILIIGSSANTYALAKNLSKTCDIFVAPGSPTIKEFTTCLDIREDSITELLEFVMENQIDLTIVSSINAINADIATIFTNNSQPIFAPTQNSAQLILDKIGIKKILYKLRIPTPKFGIFEKQNMAADYIKNIQNPFVIKTDEPSSAIVLTSTNSAKLILDNYFCKKNQRVLIEDYIWGTPFAFYVITDGYKALPIGSSILYKHSLEGNGGQLTNGMGASSPNYKLSIDNEYFLMDNVIYPLLEYLQTNESPYTGIIGVNGILTENGSFQILGFTPTTQDCDTDAILNILDENLYALFESCVVGSFSDEYEFIKQKDFSCTSIVLNCKNKNNYENVIYGLETLDDDINISFYNSVSKNKYLEYEAENGAVMVISAIGRTPASATKKAYDNVVLTNFNGISYRKDICKTLESNF